MHRMCYDILVMPGQFNQYSSVLFFILYLWSLFWKGFGLWRAAKASQRNWFIAILVLNTVGILEIIYLFKFAKPKLTLEELQFWKTA